MLEKMYKAMKTYEVVVKEYRASVTCDKNDD